MPVLVPAGYHSNVSDDGAEFVVVMEDLAGNRMLDQTVHLDDADAEACVDNLAVWHANWWNRTDGMCESGVAVALADPIYPAMLPTLFDEGWAKLNASTGCVPPESLQPVGPKFGAAVEDMLGQLSEGPMTLLHGDYRTDNMMFNADGSVILMDFQLIGVGSAAYDLAYFVGSCLEVDAARERELFDRWIAALVAAGVPESDLENMWEKYRVASLFCLVYPAVASRGMDLDVPRERDLANVMMSRRGACSRRPRLAVAAALIRPVQPHPGADALVGPAEVRSRCGERLESVSPNRLPGPDPRSLLGTSSDPPTCSRRGGG